jgi:hypothetical protein
MDYSDVMHACSLSPACLPSERLASLSMAEIGACSSLTWRAGGCRGDAGAGSGFQLLLGL